MRDARSSPIRIALGAGLAVWILLGPWLQAALLARFGVRGVALVSLAWSVAGLLGARPAVPGDLTLGRVPFAGVALLTSGAALTGSALWLMLLPAWVYAALAALFWRSRSASPGGVIGRLARLVDRLAPDFVDPYCNKLSAVWAASFALFALGIAGCALFASRETWSLVAGVLVYAAMALLQLVEYVVRKLWFRHYSRGPLDGLFARYFPAEATAEGRRSRAYIREMRARLAAEAAASHAPEPPSRSGTPPRVC